MKGLKVYNIRKSILKISVKIKTIHYLFDYNKPEISKGEMQTGFNKGLGTLVGFGSVDRYSVSLCNKGSQV